MIGLLQLLDPHPVLVVFFRAEPLADFPLLVVKLSCEHLPLLFDLAFEASLSLTGERSLLLLLYLGFDFLVAQVLVVAG